jgi:Leucine-rich repeat (LRR) protein
MIEVRATTDRGLGVFATAPIRQGDRILAEEPLLSRSVETMQQDAEQQGGAEEGLRAALATLNEEQRQMFYSLAVAKHREQSAHGIWLSNAYLTDRHPTQRTGIFHLISRFNHACCPVAHIAWNPTIKRMTVHALEDIPAEAEITVAYFSTGEGGARAAWKARLQREFGFECTCSLCMLEGDALAQSDARQERIAELRSLIDRILFSASPGTPPGCLVPLVTEQLSLLEAEGQRASWDTMACAAWWLQECGDIHGARMWVLRAAECARVALGADSEEYRRYAHAAQQAARRIAAAEQQAAAAPQAQAGDSRGASLDHSDEELTDEDAASIANSLLAEQPAALTLAANQLTVLPLQLCRVASLQHLDVGFNRIASLPEDIGMLKRLLSLSLSSNALVTLPCALCDLDLLRTLHLGGNQLAGLPDAMGGLRSLRALGLNCNRLVALSPSMGALGSLETLRLHGNGLRILPPEMGHLHALRSLALGGNLIERLPDALGALGGLKALALNCNRLLELPAAIGSLRSLEALAVEGNRLTALCPEIGSCGALRTLACGGNQLERLPHEIGSLKSLASLELGGNRLSALPGSIGELQSLTALNICGNALTELPAELGRLPALHTVCAPGNRWLEGGLSAEFQSKTLWIDREVTLGPAVVFSRRIAGAYASEVPYLNFLQATGSSRTLIVAFGVSGFDFGGVIARSGAQVDVLFLYDQAHTSFSRDAGTLRAFLMHTKAPYAHVAAVGSSQSAFGALHYLDCFDSVLAISPLDSFVQTHIHLSANSSWLPEPAGSRSSPCQVTIHVAEENFLDLQYVHFCEAAQRRASAAWSLRVVKHAGAKHPAYPGDAAVHNWVQGVDEGLDGAPMPPRADGTEDRGAVFMS